MFELLFWVRQLPDVGRVVQNSRNLSAGAPLAGEAWADAARARARAGKAGVPLAGETRALFSGRGRDVERDGLAADADAVAAAAERPLVDGLVAVEEDVEGWGISAHRPMPLVRPGMTDSLDCFINSLQIGHRLSSVSVLLKKSWHSWCSIWLQPRATRFVGTDPSAENRGSTHSAQTSSIMFPSETEEPGSCSRR